MKSESRSSQGGKNTTRSVATMTPVKCHYGDHPAELSFELAWHGGAAQIINTCVPEQCAALADMRGMAQNEPISLRYILINLNSETTLQWIDWPSHSPKPWRWL